MQNLIVTQKQEVSQRLNNKSSVFRWKRTGVVTDGDSMVSADRYGGVIGMDVGSGSVRSDENININNDNLVNRVDSLTNFSSHSQGQASYRAKMYPPPKFSGLAEEWLTFIEDFRQTTAEFEYSSLQNIIRIREAAPKKTVESLLSSWKNVEVIIETLKITYGRPEQPADKKSNLKAGLLVKFSTKVTNMVRFLQTANVTHK